MLHTFENGGKYFALDVDSGAVHQLDEMAYDALTLPQGNLTTKYGVVDAGEVLAEIAALKDSGVLDTHHNYEDIDARTGGVIKAVCLHVSHDCNLRCKYCFASAGDFHSERALMSAVIGSRALDWLIEHSGNRRHLEVDFFGGEPMMNFEVVKKILEYGRRLEKTHNKEIAFTLTTNCVGLTDEMIDYLNANMQNLVLSIDGRKAIHDFMRPTSNGKGSYDAALKAAQKIVENRNGQYYVRGTYTARNLDFSRDVLALNDAGFGEISVEPVVLPNDSPYALTEEMLPRIFEEYDALADAITGRDIRFFHFIIDLDGGPCIRKRLKGCGAGNEYVAITPEGDIFPCHQFVGRDGYKMGSIVTDEFDKTMQAVFAANHVLNKPKCVDCWAKYHCAGGCAANAHAFSGNINAPYPLECALEKKRLECAIRLASEK